MPNVIVHINFKASAVPHLVCYCWEVRKSGDRCMIIYLNELELSRRIGECVCRLRRPSHKRFSLVIFCSPTTPWRLARTASSVLLLISSHLHYLPAYIYAGTHDPMALRSCQERRSVVLWFVVRGVLFLRQTGSVSGLWRLNRGGGCRNSCHSVWLLEARTSDL